MHEVVFLRQETKLIYQNRAWYKSWIRKVNWLPETTFWGLSSSLLKMKKKTLIVQFYEIVKIIIFFCNNKNFHKFREIAKATYFESFISNVVAPKRPAE